MKFYNLRLFNKISIIALLIIFNMLFHFVPFERASIAPDTYACLVDAKEAGLMNMSYYLLIFPHRPLNHLILDIQSKLAEDNPRVGLLLVFLSSSFILLTIFFLLNKLFNDSFFALLGSIIYSLLPNTLEIYHNTIFFNINLAIGLYILSLILFLYFSDKHSKLFFIVSITIYSLVIFWYEVGFFLPIVLILYCFIFNKKRSIKYASAFIVPAMIYLVMRVTSVFGLGNASSSPHQISLLGIGPSFIELFHSYFGRYMVRSILYGIYKFLSIEQPLLTFIIFLDVILLICLFIWLRKKDLTKIDNRLLLLSSIIFIAFLMPNFINKTGAIAGRHLILPSIGIVIFVIWLLEKARRYWRVIFLSFVTLTLIVCQGNAWTQVVACRINGAVYSTLREMKDELSKANNIIIDTRSFADNIPFTWIERDFNVLNTYYGAQTFENWGLLSMASLVLENNRTPVYIATESPRINKNGLLEFAVSEVGGHRSISKVKVTLPEEKAVIIDFKSVYREGYRNGLRKK